MMWRLSGTTACWESERLRARMDVACPERGMTDLVWEGCPLSDTSLLQMHLRRDTRTCAMRLKDWYVRGSELVAQYADARQQVVFPEFSWRISDETTESEGVVLESLLSVHTHLLDSTPEIAVQCTMPADRYQVWHAREDATLNEQASEHANCPDLEVTASGCAVVWQSSAHPLVFCELVHPADVSHAEIACDETSRLVTSRISYFPGCLEKGVIRRVRSRGILTRGDRALRLLTDQWQDFLLAPPPLAT